MRNESATLDFLDDPWPTDHVELHESTEPAVIAQDQCAVVRMAVAEFVAEWPDLELIPHAITQLCDLPLWTVRRRLHELGLGPACPMIAPGPRSTKPKWTVRRLPAGVV
jgi:hypothetical protein